MLLSLFFFVVIRHRRPADRGPSYTPTPLTTEPPSRTDLEVVGVAVPQAELPVHNYPVKERKFYIKKFAETFNIVYNTSLGYLCKYSDKHLSIELTAFGSTSEVYKCKGDNKHIKNGYLALLLSECQIDKFLVLIAQQGGVAEEQWWNTTPEN